VPDGFSDWIVKLCLFLYYVAFLFRFYSGFVVNGVRQTLVRIDIMFLIFYYVVFYWPYQAELIGLSSISNNKFLESVYIEFVNRSVVASTIGVLGFCLGFSYRNYGADNFVKIQDIDFAKFCLIFSNCLVVILLAIYFLSGAESYMSGEYTGVASGNVANDGVFFLITHFSMISSAIGVYIIYRNRLYFRGIFLQLIPAIFWMIMLLGSGDRNNFLLISLVFFSGYYVFFKKINIITFVIVGILGFSLYQVVEISRSSGKRDIYGVIDSIVSFKKEDAGGIDESSFSLTTLTSRAIFLENPNAEAQFFGKFKLIGFMGVIPFSRKIVISENDPYITSADYISEIVLGYNRTWSIGSNIISDIILDFGIMGVPVLMLLLGLIFHRIQGWVQEELSVSSCVIYLMSISVLFEMPRYSYDFPVRNIAWAYLFFWMSKKIHAKFFESIK
jgi:oligosaccharide repeat unit polymerase